MTYCLANLSLFIENTENEKTKKDVHRTMYYYSHLILSYVNLKTITKILQKYFDVCAITHFNLWADVNCVCSLNIKFIIITSFENLVLI